MKTSGRLLVKLRHLGGRFVVMLSGEVLQSVFNFVLNITLARTLPAKGYGQFAIVVLIGGLGMIYIRSLVGVPACTFIPQSLGRRAARAFSVSFGSVALALSAIMGSIAAMALVLWEPCSALAGGAFIGAWSFRSYVRMALFAERHSTKATLSDLVFTLSATALCAPLVWEGGHLSLQNIFLALTAANVVGVVVALTMLGQPVRVSFRRSVRIRFRKLLPTMTWSIVSVTMSNIQSQGPTLLIAALAGPAAYAPIAATLAFFSPLRMASSALQNMIQPDLALGLSGKDPHRLPRRLANQSAVIGTICVMFGVVMAVVFPLLAHRLFAGRFEGASMTTIAFLLWSIATVAVSYSVPKTVLETMLDFRGTTVISFWAALVGLPVAALLVLTVSPAAALVGLLISEVMVLVGCWIAALRTVRRRCDTVAAAGGVAARDAGLDLSLRTRWRALVLTRSASMQSSGPRAATHSK